MVLPNRRITKGGGKVRRESERLIVPWKRGNPPHRGPRGGKGASGHGAVGGKHDGDFELQSRVHRTTTDSGAGASTPQMALWALAQATGAQPRSESVI